MRRLLPAVALLLLLFPARAQAAYHPHWSLTIDHLDWATASRVVRVEHHSYPLARSTARPIGHVTRVIRKSPHVRDRISWPIFTSPTSSGRREMWEVTYYTDTGFMADGNYTHGGAAACGYDVPFFTRVAVPGVGVLVCEDRIGANPWHHIDVWGYRPGLGNDYRLVTVYAR